MNINNMQTLFIRQNGIGVAKGSLILPLGQHKWGGVRLQKH